MNISKKTIVAAVLTVIVSIASSGSDIDRPSTRNDHSTLNGNEKGAERFEGIFGRKFGEQVVVDAKDRVWGLCKMAMVLDQEQLKILINSLVLKLQTEV